MKLRKVKKENKRFLIILEDKKSLFLILSSIFIHVLFFSLSQFLPAFLSKLPNGYEILSISRTINGTVGLVTGIYLLALIRKIANYNYIIPISAAYIVFFILMLMLVDYQWLFYLFSAAMSVFYFISAVGIKTIFANGINSESSGIYLSAFSLTGRVGNIGASCLLAISGFVGYNAVIALLTVFGILSMVCLIKASQNTIISS